MHIDYSNIWFQQNHQLFHKWFDKTTFKWKESWLLAVYCKDYFHDWFELGTFDWQYTSYLSYYCIEYIDTWYYPEIYKQSKEQILITNLEQKMAKHLI